MKGFEDRESAVRAEAWRRFQLAYPDGSDEAFERAWPALRDGILIEESRRMSQKGKRLSEAA